MPLMKRSAEIVVLAKPQFEVGKGEVGKGGIVRDPVLHQRTVDKVRGVLQDLGFHEPRTMDSPILGAEGNKEFLIYGSQRN